MTIFQCLSSNGLFFLEVAPCDVSLSDYVWYYSCTRRSCVHNISTALKVHIYLEISTYLQAFYYSLAQRYLTSFSLLCINLTLCFVMTMWWMQWALSVKDGIKVNSMSIHYIV